MTRQHDCWASMQCQVGLGGVVGGWLGGWVGGGGWVWVTLSGVLHRCSGGICIGGRCVQFVLISTPAALVSAQWQTTSHLAGACRQCAGTRGLLLLLLLLLLCMLSGGAHLERLAAEARPEDVARYKGRVTLPMRQVGGSDRCCAGVLMCWCVWSVCRGAVDTFMLDTL